MALELGLQTRTLRSAEQRNARQSWTERSSILLTISDPLGAVALGEATPLDGYSPDTFSDALSALHGLKAAEVDAALHSPDLGTALTGLSALLPAQCRSARFALETAALHYFAQAQRVPRTQLLSTLLGGVSTEASLANMEPAQLLDLRGDWLSALSNLRRHGTRCFKVKIGVNEDERSSLQQLRQQLRADEQLRLDANGKWPTALNPSDVADLGVQFVEEPLPALAEPQALSFPVALDESLFHQPEAARRWVEAGIVAAIVVKPMCLALLPALDWCRHALRHHVPVVVSHCFDGAVAHSVYRALARVVAQSGVAPGLGSHSASALWREEAQAHDDAL